MANTGQIIRAADFSQLAQVRNARSFTNFSTTGWEPTTTSTELTFVAPTLSIVRITIGIRIDADLDDERIETDVQVRLHNALGAIIHSPSITDGQGLREDFPSGSLSVNVSKNRVGWRYLTSLRAGQQYWVQLQHRTANIDIDDQYVTVEGIP